MLPALIYNALLIAKDLEALLVVDESLLSSGFQSFAKDKFSVQLPFLRKTVLLVDALVGQIAVVLQVGSQSSGLEHGPHIDLSHARRVCGPLREAVSIGSNLLLVTTDSRLILEEEDSAGCSLEALDSLRALFEVFRAGDSLDGVVDRL